MKIEANSDAVEDFTKYLIEIRGAFKVADDGEIQYSDGEPVEIEIGDVNKRISSYRETSSLRDHLMLNIFTDNITNTAPVDWFYSVMSKQLSTLLRIVFEDAIPHKEETEDDKQYVRMELASVFKGDKTVLKDLEKIDSDDLLYIHWFKKDKTAQLQTKIFDKEYIESKSFKPKNINIIQKAFKTIFKFDEESEFNENYKFISSILSIPQCEARLRIILLTLKKIEKFYCAFHPDVENFNLQYFEDNLPNLTKYYSIACSVNAPTASTAIRSELESKSNAPITIPTKKEFKSAFSPTPTISFGRSQEKEIIINPAFTPPQRKEFVSPFASTSSFGRSGSSKVKSPFA